jgi:hypothetical protein
MNDPGALIPTDWRTKVVAILRGREPGTVMIRQRARREWASLPFCPFDYELADAITAALEDERLVGKKHQMEEPGETYAFIFSYRDTPVYAKVNLTTLDNVVIVYSAHRPLKGDQLP